MASCVKGVKITDSEFRDSGTVSKEFAANSVSGAGFEFSRNEVINCESANRFTRYINSICDNTELDLVSPSYQSFDAVDTFTGNKKVKGSCRKTSAGVFHCYGNDILIDFTLGAATRAAIVCGFSGTSNKGSIVGPNTITNNSSDGVCILIDTQNSETANVIVNGNHCGLGTNDVIDDNATGTVFGTTNVATVV